MIVTVKHFQMLKRLEQGGLEKLEELTPEDLEVLLHLRLAGLITEEEESFALTRSGLLILESLRTAEEANNLNFSDLYENYRLVGSRIISMLQIAERAQGRTDFNQEINKELEERGFARDGRLQPWAQAILEAYRSATVEFFVTPELARSILALPLGPARKNFLEPIPEKHIFQLEAQRLLTFTVPEGEYYAFTGVGSQLWAALRTGLVPEVSISVSTLRDIVENKKTETLETLGAIDPQGNLTVPGKHLLMAARLFFEPIIVNPSIDLSGWNISVLRAVKASPVKTREGIEEFLAAQDTRDPFKVKQSLYRLEGFRLIASEPDGSYSLTPYGEELLALEDLAPVHAQAVMAITVTRTENMPPDDGWVKTAEEQGVVGNGFPSQKGRLLAEIASSIDRLPVVTREEMLVMRGIPLWRGVSEEEILNFYPEEKHPQVLHGLRKLLAQGLVDLLPGGLYVLTPAGEKIKQGLSAVPNGVDFPLTPQVWYVLLALREIGRFSPQGRKIRVRKEDYDKLEEKVKNLAPEIIGSALETARLCRYISGLDVLETGVNLLEGLDLLKNLKTNWEEIRIYA
ncbi:DUF505 family protein [Thermodesulfatator autotrophicus]|uniref:Uncharacterized protein n=1 Tax=Thermodesulfatator autotrophicus TaxID=1795632 RepID=A0A177E7P2_9BACT|nr:DUF505 family protein [Thermodesulfatator autotrophicus]OAG27967.1 hypothetical protein TH606_04320 [Thermodesulfatator autotrophicus]